jgi:Na+-transporting NADH:ubiquinone oxidoreductase subunit NqrC
MERRRMPGIWVGTMVILVLCLIASMVIATVKLL